jgi:hypothetical protein
LPPQGFLATLFELARPATPIFVVKIEGLQIIIAAILALIFQAFSDFFVEFADCGEKDCFNGRYSSICARLCGSVCGIELL